MEPSDWIALAAIGSGGFVSWYSLRIADRQRREDRRHDRADARTERAIEVYTLAEDLVDDLDPRKPSPRGFDGTAASRQLHGELEWLAVMGWTGSIREAAEQVADCISDVEAAGFWLGVNPEEDEKVKGQLTAGASTAREAIGRLRRAIQAAIE